MESPQDAKVVIINQRVFFGEIHRIGPACYPLIGGNLNFYFLADLLFSFLKTDDYCESEVSHCL